MRWPITRRGAAIVAIIVTMAVGFIAEDPFGLFPGSVTFAAFLTILYGVPLVILFGKAIGYLAKQIHLRRIRESAKGLTLVRKCESAKGLNV